MRCPNQHHPSLPLQLIFLAARTVHQALMTLAGAVQRSPRCDGQKKKSDSVGQRLVNIEQAVAKKQVVGLWVDLLHEGRKQTTPPHLFGRSTFSFYPVIEFY